MSFVEVSGNPAPEGAREEWYEGKGGVRLRALTAPALGAARGSVIVCPGRTEFIEKYFEVIRAVQARGFAVFCLDWRGQGLSARATKNSEKGHLRSMDDAAEDLAKGVALYADRLPKPHVILAHSMGGAIVLRGLQTGQVRAEAAAFSAPMWGLSALRGPVKGIVATLAGLGMGASFAPGVQTKWVLEEFSTNPVTHDEARHARCNRLLEAEPRLALAGPTYGWIAASAKAMDGFTAANLKDVTLPVLIATAGEEMLVDNSAHARVAAALANAAHITIPGAKHEILMERDELQAPFWAAFDALIDRVAPKKA